MASPKPDLSLIRPDEAAPLAILAHGYLASRRAQDLSLRTIDNYRHYLFDLFLPWCELEGIREPGHLSRRVLEGYARKLHLQGGKTGRTLSKDSVHSYLRPVNSFVGWLQEEGEAVSGKAPLPRLPKRDVDVLSREEIDTLERSAKTERDRLIIRVLGDTGYDPFPYRDCGPGVLPHLSRGLRHSQTRIPDCWLCGHGGGDSRHVDPHRPAPSR